MKSGAETQLQVAIGVLVDSLADKSHLVFEAASSSLLKLAEKHPNQVLISCSDFCAKTPKPTNEHLGHILGLMSKVCKEHIVNIDGDTIINTIEFSLKIMTEYSSYEPGVQMPASNVLVALGRLHYLQVTDALLKNLQAGVIPHYTIPHTMGELAGTNAYGVIPYLKDILNIMLPLLGGLRTDHLKQAFAFALQNFCESLVEYVSNLDQTPDPTITTESFKTELGMAYDVLFSSWLQSKESKVVEAVLEALSAIFVILPIDKVSQQIPKIIPLLLGLYKRNINPYIITKCLYAVLTKAASVNGMLLEPLLSNILNQLSDLVCLNPDYAQPDSARCHSEVLRCYECIAIYFTDTTIDKLLILLKNNNERDKLKGLIVITHLIAYSAKQTIHRRIKDILRHINDMLTGSNLKTRKVLVKIIVALAHKRVLINKDLNPDGAELYLEFILKMCCRQSLPKNADVPLGELQEIQTSSDNALYVLTTTVPELESILWHLLLQCFLSTAYDDAIVILLRCLTYLASKKDPAHSSEAAFVRCMVLLSNPWPSLRGTFILNFLRNIAPCDTSLYKTVWDGKLPQLSKYLDQNYDGFNSVEWHDQLFDFINFLLENVNNGAFNEVLLSKAQSQLELYNNTRNGSIYDKNEVQIKLTEKRFLLKFIAVILCYLKTKEMVMHTLDSLLVNVRFTDYSELHACAEAVGIVSRIHLRLVLEKLAHIRKEIISKKASKFFSFMKNHTHELGIERLRYVIVYSYAEVCNEAPSEHLLRVIESEVLEFVLNELANSKEFATKRVCLRAIQSIADAMHPNRNTLHVKLAERDKVIDVVFEQMQLHSGPDYIELFPIIISAMTALIKLPLALESHQRIKLVKVFFDNIYNASSIYCKITTNNSDNFFGDLKLVPCVTRSFTELNQLIQELIVQDLSPSTLDEIVTLLEVWLAKKKPEQRLPAIETLRLVLQTYLDNMRFAHDLPSTFSQTGRLLSKIVPRCTDPVKNIRKVAVDCIYLVLCIAGRYEGHMRDHDKVLKNSMRNVQQNIESEDPKLLFNLTSDLAHIISVDLPQFQVIHLIDGLIESLLDCEPSSSNGTSVVLNIILKNKGNGIQNHVAHVTEAIVAQLDKIQCPRTKSSTLRALSSFASHHSRIVGGILLMQPLPYESSICDCWAMLSNDHTLVLDLLDHIKKLMKTTPLYEPQGNSDIKVATLSPLQAVCALHELLKNSQLKEICTAQFSEFFSLLLICLASYIGCSAPAVKSLSDKKEKYGLILNRDAYKLNPAKVAFDTFRLFLTCCEFTNMATNLLCFNTFDSTEDRTIFLKVVETLTNNICSDVPQSLSWIVACLGPFIRSDLEPQKIAVVAFFTYLLKQGNQKEQTVLIENLLEMIMDAQGDQSCTVRKIGLEGLGYAAENLSRELVSRYCNQILGVLMNSLDYNNIGSETELILESLLTFSKLLNALEGYKFHSFQVTAAVRIKLLFEQEDCQLRRASLQLLGDLASSLTPETNLEAFKEQTQGNLITLLLHLCDPDIYVVKACKYTLRKIGPHLESTEVNNMIQDHLIDEANLHYADFIKDLIKRMSNDLQDLFYLFVMTSVSYLKSPWIPIRSNAALVTGLLYSELSVENKPKVSLDTVCDKLIRLLQDDSEEVRVKASQAISYLFIN
ncbi:maestro heat-like repeat-containing protein family member 1 isoform X1 [Euwallacea fornicatus]|uniref:maestro heat-like repeat-containing protein family member 1 isoform X1 n=2 Tax=Euwallacea fornicatus TaxID=995702 RepID=UPI00338FDFCB